MNKLMLAMVVFVSLAIVVMAEDHARFKWPFFTNSHHHHHHDTPSLMKKFQCGTSIHNVYACLRSSFIHIDLQNHNLRYPSNDCCTAIHAFRERCIDYGIGKLESFIIPPMLSKKCPTNDSPAGLAPAPAEADGPAAADDMQF
ncbi:hypothetical protein CTI12_AA037770 [Artemisia annua]|uniref:Prolamin-like domain-containing protein n=1 Tax=Artemisia annua TaxID=35608 RepID=A0A2U1QEQ9_ARTAN|nr:hypothetical protein CTI12_AA037770 [Artemisia annua]